MLASARAAYQHELSMWTAIAPHSKKKLDPPNPPAILRGIVH
jgi:hypothetical protein